MTLSIKKLVFFSLITYSVNIISIPQQISDIISARRARLSQAPLKTIDEALSVLTISIAHFPKDERDIQAYEKKQAEICVKAARMLYGVARVQILEALSEIDNRITYWQYQKDHQWNYFLSKNPLKWVTGPKQEDEIENNLELLESHQGELYALLGQLSEQGNIFNQQYKDVFLTDYTQAYKWIDSLLVTLMRIKPNANLKANNPTFIARAESLKIKLQNVAQFKDQLLSDMPETGIPSYFMRNWLKVSSLLLGLSYGYKNFTLQQLQQPIVAIGKEIERNVIDPVQLIIKDVFFGGSSQEDLLISQKNIDVMYNTVKAFLDTLSTESGLVRNLDITEEGKQAILAEIKSGNSSLFQALTDELSRGGILKKKKWLDAKAVLYDLYLLQSGARIQRTLAGVGKLAFMTPAIASTWLAYAGYQKFAEKNYYPLRYALVEINSLFVDASRPMNDEQYGKMIYLIHMLKKQARKDLPTKKNLQADFILDLEKIESSEFNVAAKRAIIEDMFKKYDFLGLIQKK